MHHKQSATPFGRRSGVLYPNWDNSSTIEQSQKALFKKRLPSALDARAGAFPAQLTQIAHPQNFAYRVRVRAVRGGNSRSLVPVRMGLSIISSWCRYRPGLMLFAAPADRQRCRSASTNSSRRPRAARKSEPRTRSINQGSLRQSKRSSRTVSVPDASKP